MTLQSKTIRLLQDILKENAAERPNKVALICEDRRLTYSQVVDAYLSRLHQAFQSLGVSIEAGRIEESGYAEHEP